MSRPSVFVEIGRERDLQDAVWGEQNRPNGTGPELQLLDVLPRYSNLRDTCKAHTDIRAGSELLTFADILLEEVFEAVAEEDPGLLRAELIQVAAVAAQWVEALDRAEARAAADTPLTASEPEVGEPCTCTNFCSDDRSLIDCPFCKTLDVYDPCPVVGFGCGAECGDDEHCTPEQQKAADG